MFDFLLYNSLSSWELSLSVCYDIFKFENLKILEGTTNNCVATLQNTQIKFMIGIITVLGNHDALRKIKSEVGTISPPKNHDVSGSFK